MTVHYISIGPDGCVASAGRAPEHMRDAISVSHKIVTEDQFSLLELRGASGARYRLVDGELKAVAPEAPSHAEMLMIAKRRRDSLLAASDRAVLPDFPRKGAGLDDWMRYRALLRDVPLQPGFPATITWPQAPEGTQ